MQFLHAIFFFNKIWFTFIYNPLAIYILWFALRNGDSSVVQNIVEQAEEISAFYFNQSSICDFQN